MKPGAAELSARLPDDPYHRKVQKERQEAAARLFRVWRDDKDQARAASAAATRQAAAAQKSGGNGALLYGLLGVAGAALLIFAAPWLISLAPGRFFQPEAPLPAAASLLGYSSAAAFNSDQRAARSALKTVMSAGPGAQEKWTNPETGNLGLLWVEGQLGGTEGDCRKVTQRMNVQRGLWETSFTSCRTATGWSSELGWENAGRPNIRPPRQPR
ncbi:hypothetical protein BKE38_21465 [Pseudoroseomonas deserti]|uniref:Uncharacterized protein n=1 Tax=Teichococcus deserti TaxID=1817963 RepID=A0A1V2GYG6_9PROT|nr:hypothetical protein BKE38_21465 [Pseudoroseomonas deserti]